MDKDTIKEKVLLAMDQIRPFLHADGGDVELVEVRDDATVIVRLMGACSDCSMSVMTLKAGIEDTIMRAVPEVKAVLAENLSEQLN